VNAFPYRRLAGTRRGLFSRASAWAGPDHILLVEGSRFSESYKRVYYRDVKALLVTRRNRFVIDAWFWLIPVALLVGIAWLPADWRATGSLAAALILVGVLVYLYIAAFFYGCRLYLATAVGNVWVRSVFRVWQARRFHEQVKPMILAAQQALIQNAG
jgi:hypothetical protein